MVEKRENQQTKTKNSWVLQDKLKQELDLWL